MGLGLLRRDGDYYELGKHVTVERSPAGSHRRNESALTYGREQATEHAAGLQSSASTGGLHTSTTTRHSLAHFAPPLHFVERSEVLDAVNRVLRSRERRRLVIVGENGAGKTALARWIRRQLVRAKRADELQVLYFEVRKSDDLTRTPDCLARSLLEGLGDRIHEQFATLTPKDDAWPFVWSALEQHQVMSGGQVLLLVDAIDEAKDPETFEKLLTGDLPPDVTLVVTTRHRRYLEHLARSRTDVRDLYAEGAQREATDQAIRDYVSTRFSDVETPPPSIIDGMVTKAAGRFIWAEHAGNLMLSTRRQNGTWMLPEAVPTELADVYHREIGRFVEQLHADLPTARHNLEDMLAVLAVAVGDGLTLTQLSGCLGLGTETTRARLDALIDFVERVPTTSGLPDGPEGSVVPRYRTNHTSAGETFAPDGSEQAAVAHQRLARLLESHLATLGRETPHSDAEYLVKALVHHASTALETPKHVALDDAERTTLRRLLIAAAGSPAFLSQRFARADIATLLGDLDQIAAHLERAPAHEPEARSTRVLSTLLRSEAHRLNGRLHTELGLAQQLYNAIQRTPWDEQQQVDRLAAGLHEYLVSPGWPLVPVVIRHTIGQANPAIIARLPGIARCTNDEIVVCTAGSLVECRSLNDGRLVWRLRFPHPVRDAVFTAEVVIVLTASETTFCRLADGAIIDGGSLPAVHDAIFAVGDDRAFLYGDESWLVDTTTGTTIGGPLPAADDVILVGDHRAFLRGKESWLVDTITGAAVGGPLPTAETTVLVADHRVLFYGSDEWRLVDTATGTAIGGPLPEARGVILVGYHRALFYGSDESWVVDTTSGTTIGGPLPATRHVIRTGDSRALLFRGARPFSDLLGASLPHESQCRLVDTSTGTTIGGPLPAADAILVGDQRVLLYGWDESRVVDTATGTTIGGPLPRARGVILVGDRRALLHHQWEESWLVDTTTGTTVGGPLPSAERVVSAGDHCAVLCGAHKMWLVDTTTGTTIGAPVPATFPFVCDVILVGDHRALIYGDESWLVDTTTGTTIGGPLPRARGVILVGDRRAVLYGDESWLVDTTTGTTIGGPLLEAADVIVGDHRALLCGSDESWLVDTTTGTTSGGPLPAADVILIGDHRALLYGWDESWLVDTTTGTTIGGPLPAATGVIPIGDHRAVLYGSESWLVDITTGTTIGGPLPAADDVILVGDHLAFLGGWDESWLVDTTTGTAIGGPLPVADVVVVGDHRAFLCDGWDESWLVDTATGTTVGGPLPGASGAIPAGDHRALLFHHANFPVTDDDLPHEPQSWFVDTTTGTISGGPLPAATGVIPIGHDRALLYAWDESWLVDTIAGATIGDALSGASGAILVGDHRAFLYGRNESSLVDTTTGTTIGGPLPAAADVIVGDDGALFYGWDESSLLVDTTTGTTISGPLPGARGVILVGDHRAFLYDDEWCLVDTTTGTTIGGPLPAVDVILIGDHRALLYGWDESWLVDTTTGTTIGHALAAATGVILIGDHQALLYGSGASSLVDTRNGRVVADDLPECSDVIEIEQSVISEHILRILAGSSTAHLLRDDRLVASFGAAARWCTRPKEDYLAVGEGSAVTIFELLLDAGPEDATTTL